MARKNQVAEETEEMTQEIYENKLRDLMTERDEVLATKTQCEIKLRDLDERLTELRVRHGIPGKTIVSAFASRD